jgi:hypothetical protein
VKKWGTDRMFGGVMKWPSKVHLVLHWIIAVFLAWVFGRCIVWNILVFSIRYDVTSYDVKRALYGLSIFTISTLIFSAMRDFRYSDTTRMPIDFIQFDSRSKILELSVFASRINLVGYVYVFWIKYGSYILNQNDMINVSDLFPVLLGLGASVGLLTLIFTYIFIFEPWRVFLLKETDGLIGIRRSSYLSVARLLSLIVINLLLFWFYLPRLGTKLPSLISFLVLLLIIVGYRKYFSSTLNAAE